MNIYDFSNNSNVIWFYAVCVGAVILMNIPYIGMFFRSIVTLVHEMSHAVMALIMGGSVGRLDINQDRSGAIRTKVKSKFGRILVSLSGYIFASLFVYFSFYLVKIGYSVGLLFIFFIVALFGLVFLIRNKFGVLWLLAFCTGDVLLLYFGSDNLKLWVAVVVCIVMFMDSFYSVIELFVITLNNSKNAGDAKNLCVETGVPAFLWAVFFMIIVGYVSYLTVVNFFPYGDLLRFNI